MGQGHGADDKADAGHRACVQFTATSGGGTRLNERRTGTTIVQLPKHDRSDSQTMLPTGHHTLCWTPLWTPDHVGFERVVVDACTASSVLLAVDDDGQAFRLTYQLQWDRRGALRHAELRAMRGADAVRLLLRTDGLGRWCGAAGDPLPHLDGCIDIDIWPTPLTNSLPIWRSGLAVGERREFRMAWVSAPELRVVARRQAYTRLPDGHYLFESLDDTGLKAVLPVDANGFVTDYPGLFRRVIAVRGAPEGSAAP